MVLPLVVGAARVATTTAKVGAKAGNAAIKTGRAASRVGSRGGRAARNITKPARRGSRQSSVVKNRNAAKSSGIENAGYKAGRAYSKVRHRVKQTTSTFKGLSLTWQLLWFYPAQLLFAFIAYASYSALSQEYGYFWGIVMWLTSGKAIALGIFLVAWICSLALGTGLLMYIAVACSTVFRMKVWSRPMIFIMFCVCVWGYWAPYYVFMFIPWTIIWVWVIVFSQK